MKRAQTVLEFAVLIVCIVGALIAMQIYLKRSMQGRLRSAADELGQQYSAGNTVSDITTTTSNSNFTKVATVVIEDPDHPGTLIDETTTQAWTGPVPTTEEPGHENDPPEVETHRGKETVGPLKSETLFP